MNLKLFTGLFLITPFLFGQQQDSMRTHTLSEVVVSGVLIQADTLESFYKSNTSATTETILSRMTGVSLIRRGSFGQEPVIRGLSSGQVNITIDGMKIFGACTDKMDPVSIYVEPINLSAIQATTGIQSSEYGSTFGGAINMTLAQPKAGAAPISGQAAFDVQSAAKARNLFSRLNVSRARSGYLTNIIYRKSDNYHAGGGNEIPFSQYEKINISTSGKWALRAHDTLQADILLDKGWNIGFPALPMDVGMATAGIYSLNFQRFVPWFIFHRAKVKAYHNTIRHTMDDTKRNDVPIHMDMPGKSSTTGFYGEADVHLFHDHQTIVKLEYFVNAVLGEMTMYPDEGSAMYMQTAPRATRHDAGFYVRQQWRINPKNKVYLTFRNDIVIDKLHDGIGKHQVEIINGPLPMSSALFAKTLGVTYTRRLTSNMKFEVQGGYGQRMPTLNERFGFYLFNRMDNFDYLGNPHLRPESSWTSEILWGYYGSSIELQLTPFYKSIRNYIIGEVSEGVAAMTIGASGVKQHVNLHGASLSGFEAMMLARPLKAVQWITTLKYAKGIASTGEPMPLIPPLKCISSLRYETLLFNIQIEMEHAAPQYNISNSASESATPGYTLFNIRTGYKIHPGFALSVGVENVFDAVYREHLDWGGVPRPGRNIYLNATYKF